MDILTLGAWISNIFAGCGAIESSRTHIKMNAFRMNLFYTIANLYSVFYFFFTFQYPYFFLQGIFLVLSIKGLVVNYKKLK